MDKIILATFNVNGLSNSDKRREVFHYLHVKNVDIIFLQETHSTQRTAKMWMAKWGTKFYLSHGDSCSKGFAILFKKNFPIQIHNVFESGGRLLVVYGSLNGVKLTLSNIYVPNKDNPSFFQEAFVQIEKFKPDYNFIAGDFNLTFNSNIDRQGTTYNNDNAAKWLAVHLDNAELIDFFRYLYPDSNGFTWHAIRGRPIFSRLDYIFCSETAVQFIDKIEVCPSYKSDHSMVVMYLSLNPFKRGPGY